MTSLAVLENKASAVRKYLVLLERYQQYTKEEIEDNIDIRGAVERYLYLAVQSTIDLAEAIIAYKRLRKPTTMAESFHILHEAGIISLRLKKSLVHMTGFRNAMTHAYENLDYDIVLDVLHTGREDIVDFLNAVEPRLQQE
jgi:uncharacterized protein YutE (UPF0331/DUF86 family)